MFCVFFCYLSVTSVTGFLIYLYLNRFHMCCHRCQPGGWAPVPAWWVTPVPTLMTPPHVAPRCASVYPQQKCQYVLILGLYPAHCQNIILQCFHFFLPQFYMVLIFIPTVKSHFLSDAIINFWVMLRCNNCILKSPPTSPYHVNIDTHIFIRFFLCLVTAPSRAVTRHSVTQARATCGEPRRATVLTPHVAPRCASVYPQQHCHIDILIVIINTVTQWFYV